MDKCGPLLIPRVLNAVCSVVVHIKVYGIITKTFDTSTLVVYTSWIGRDTVATPVQVVEKSCKYDLRPNALILMDLLSLLKVDFPKSLENEFSLNWQILPLFLPVGL